jgi:hypothetical protein
MLIAVSLILAIQINLAIISQNYYCPKCGREYENKHQGKQSSQGLGCRYVL